MMKLPLMVEIIGITVTMVGIFYELKYRAEIGYLLITVGSVFVAIGGMLYAKILRRKK